MPVRRRCRRPAAPKLRPISAHNARAAARCLSLVLGLLVCACGSAAAQTAALSAPVVTPGDLTNALAAGAQFQPQVARGGGGFLAVWADDRTVMGNLSGVAPFTGAGRGRGHDIYAARLDAAGNVIDTTPIVVARGLLDQSRPQVEWNGQHWLVVWLSTREDESYSFEDTYSVEIRGARVAPDGAVLDQTPIVVRASTTNSELWPREVIYDGTNWIVIWLGTAAAAPSVRSVFAARVTPAGAVLDAGEGKEIYRHNSPSLDDPDLAYSGNSFLLTFADTTTAFTSSNAVKAVRLSTALDQTGAPFRVNVTSVLGFSEPRVASDGTDYFVVWDGSASDNTSGPDRVYGSRVSNGGAVLDPGGILIAQLGTQSTQADVCWDGTRYFVSYDSDFNEATQTYSDKDVFVKRVTNAGAVLDATGIPVKVGPGPQSASAVAPGAEGGAEVVWYDVLQGLDVRGAFVSSAGAVGPDTPISLGAPSQNLPRIAAGGDGFLLVYKSVTTDDVRLLAQRLDAAGAPVGLPFLITGGTPSIDIGTVAWNGTVFLVTWADSTTGVRQINAKRVSAAGAVLDAQPIPIMQGSLPDVAALGDTFLVVGVRRLGISSPIQNIIAVRVSGAGAVLGEPVVVDYNFNDAPRVAAIGARWLVVWQGKTRHDSPTYSVDGAFVAADGAPGPEFYVGSGQSPHIAVGGDVALVVRSELNRSDTRNLHWDINATRIHSDGTVIDAVAVSNGLGSETAPAVAWDGSQFVVDWWEGQSGITQQPRADIYGARVSRTGIVVERFAVANSGQPEDTPFVAARDGLSVFAYAKFYDEAPYAAYRITLRTARFASPDPIALPAAPSGLAVSHDNIISLTWVDNSTNELGFKLEWRAAAPTSNWTEFARTGQNVTSYNNGPSPSAENGAIFYRVRAYNVAGDSAYSNVTSPPQVRITGPPVGSTYDEPATVTVTADATDADGQVTSVEFYVNGALAGIDTTAPYAITLNAVPAGDYYLRARAFDNAGQSARPPNNGVDGFAVFRRASATITSPTEGADFPDAPATVRISATAQVAETGQGGEFINRMDFYANGNLIGTVSGSLAVYNFDWSSVAAGAYTLTAVPTTNWGRTGTSNSVRITVGPAPPASGAVVISEFRTRGPGGSADEFVELYNKTDQPITVSTSDGSAGWTVVSYAVNSGAAAPLFLIPAGTIIPARGHYLVAHETGYGLNDYGGANASVGDGKHTADIADDMGLALFATQNWSQPGAVRLDSVGFATLAGADAAMLREGAGLAPVGASAAEEFSFQRRLGSGVPQDTNDNAADFVLVSTTGTVGGSAAVLGAPGPENSASPVQRNAQVKSSLVDPQCASTLCQNRVRDTNDTGALKTFGTLSIRRRFTNNTRFALTRLRFRIVDVTTLHTPGGAGPQADLRALTSGNVTVQVSGGGSIVVRGTTLDLTPAQTLGGGLHSTLSAGTITLATPLAPGASINVGFLLGVERTGTFRFFINVEAAN